MTPRSSQPTALCHSRTTATTNATTGIATPIMLLTFCAVLTGSRSGYGTHRLERGLKRGLPVRGDRIRGCTLLALDPLRHAHRLLVAGALGDALELLVGRDLQVLERVVEAGELRGGIRLCLEEPTPVECPEPHRGVLQLVRARVVGVEARLDDFLLCAGLLEVVLEQLRKPRLLDDLRRALEHLDRLALDRVCVGQVLDELLLHVVGVLVAQRRLDGAVEVVEDAALHRLLLLEDPARYLRRLLVTCALGHPGKQLV